MESNLNQDGAPRPSYVFSADPVERPSEINLDGIKLDLSHEFSLVASSDEINSLESKDYLQVCLRIRPLTQSEKEQDSEGCVCIVDSQTVLLKDPQSIIGQSSEKNSGQMVQKFHFSKVFGPETTQKEFFLGCLMQLVKDLFKGQSRLIFTYGVTNSGKTYTIQGTEENIGILPRTLNVLFDSLREKLYTKMDLKPHRSREYIRLSPEQEKEEVTNKTTLLRQIKEIAVNNDSSDTLHGTLINSLNTPEFEEVLVDCEQTSLNMDSNIKFSVWVSFFEIYNECIYDLFVPVSPKSQKRKMLRLSQDVKGYSFIKDLQWIQVSDSKEAYKLLKVGIKNQSVAFTKLNNASSRSHSIFTIRILWIEDSDMPHVVRVSELTLCDLAGSERSMKTQNEGERLRETGNINTSLLTLGKCINVLKNNEKSKFQKHVPFRESKLTHYFQSFFNGKGKICMIVNISQCDLAYDETLSVLKFSAVAQKVLVPDAFNTSLEKSCAAVKPSQAIPPDINASNNKALNIKRTTISWESNLEDLVEDEDLPEDVEKAEENQTVGIEFTEEDTEQTLEEDKILIGQEEKRKLLDLIEDLKQKLINEKKEKLTLEFKIREEVTQEFTQYLAQREADFKETLLQEREILEENAECRLAIFKDLVGKCETQEEPKNEDCTMKVETEGARNCVEIEDIFDSLQDDVSDIRKQIELAHSYIASLADPQEALSSLEIKFNQVKAELAKTREELVKTQEKLANRENESQINLNSLVQEHGKSNEDKTDESLKMNNKLTCNEIIEIHKDNTIKSSSERKRSNESEHQEDEPPAKKGPMYINPSIIEERKKSEDTQERISKENDRRVFKINNELESHLLSVENELISVKKEKAELNQLIVTLQQELSISEEKIFSLSTEVQQIQSKYKNAISELHVQKGMNQEQEIKIEILSEELETTRKNITNNVAQIKLMQTKIDELRMLDSGSPISSIDLLSLRELSSGSQKDSLMNSQLHRLSNQLKETFIQELSRDGSFHSSIEAIWEECKEIVKVSSQKSHRIQELEQKIEKLQSDVKAYAEENDRLRREERETKNQDDQLKEKDRLIQQLKEELQEKTIRLNSEVQRVVEGKRALSELTQDITGSKAKIEELEKLLEAHKDKYSSSARLEQEILEKESVILKLEKNLEEFQANLQDSIKNTKDLNEREVKLKEEITQLTNNLQDVQYSLQQKEEEHETNRQDLEKLKEDLCASCTLNQNLQADLQKKEEDYTELKEKLSDAKKQIEQVQKEVCVMRDEEKLLRLKINELEKKKNQCSQEIDMKQRTIQQLKEQLNNQKMEDTVQQYEKVCKDLNVKEKIIADMRMTLEEQEQTQMEQDQVLEAKAEELERLATELEQWKEKFKNLETKNNPNSKKEFEDTTNALSKQLRKLQDELQESEQKYTTDRKKWLDEKVKLITQAKEAENLRNIEMKKYNEDRERCLKLQKEVEKLADQLAEKETNLQRWREERDQLVAALEIQLKALISSNVQKDTEIEQLKKVTAEASKVEKPSVGIVPEHINSADPGIVEPETLPTSFETCTNEVERGSVVLDSCEVSTENVHVTRFPKPELEIQFTPLRPNKVSVKHPGCTLPVTVKISKPKKRKSSDMEEDLVKCENKKNSTPRCNLKFPVSEHRNSSVKKEQKVSVHPSTKKAYSLRSQASTVSVNLKKEGTLQKFGDFLQQSPTILQSKAKKLIETISSSKPGHTDVKEYASRPKRAKRKLYTSEISSPIDLSGEVILMDKKVKESDHQILKRRLRAKMAK